MPMTVDGLVDHLAQAKMLRGPGQSPWPSADPQKQDLYRIDWQRLLDRDGEWDQNDWALTELIRERIGAGPPKGPSRVEARKRRPDICAWYQPIHFYGIGWGIFILEDCLREIAADIARWLSTSSVSISSLQTLQTELVRAAFFTLYLHEAFHHRIESFAIRAWIVDGVPRYQPYYTQVYRPARAGSISASIGLLEEALANAYSYSRLSDDPYRAAVQRQIFDATRDYLQWRFPLDPPGYRDATRYRTKEAFEGGLHKLEEQVATATIGATQVNRWRFAPNMTESMFDIRSEIWTVVRTGQLPKLPTFPLYRPTSTQRLLKALRTEYGYDRVKGAGKGSHIRLKAVGCPPLTVPAGKKDLSPVVLRSIARALEFDDIGTMLEYLGC
ncbi:type II toxin-antitoxin system HicA family toxin [Rhodococcus sp. P14]|uniref:type II toxin-antitoxin system HicA family toxin n=1 Tax=Rhodococcus sp. P14 TaxID=450821 RepID=UPI0012F6F2B8|nr:type II toxin-antitoxin system HicA family toxin [Rhodococcus sp. P14]